MDIITFMAKFKSEKDCLDYLRDKRYKDFHCPKCDGVKFYMVYGRKLMECANCKHQEYLTANTIMHKSSTDLVKWFYAIQLMTTSKKGVSALQVKRVLSVTYKTAWRICHKIREAMDNDDDNDMFGGITQVDETWVGGTKKSNKGRAPAPKKIVVGAVEHIDGKPTRVECDVVTSVKAPQLLKFVQSKVDLKADGVHTDKWRGYLALEKMGYNHKTVNHEFHYVFEGVSTQSIEGFWSLLKRGIIGIFHHVSPQHLEKYLAEFEFRYNNRGRDNLLDLVLEKV